MHHCTELNICQCIFLFDNEETLYKMVDAPQTIPSENWGRNVQESLTTNETNCE